MKPQWHFNELRPGDKTREPTQGEFFATDAIRDPAEALIREALQNSLDAGLKNAAGQPIETVAVRIRLTTGSHAPKASDVSEFFAGSQVHYEAEGSGLRKPPGPLETCPYLVLEDFGTSGLVGDVRQWHDIPNSKNAFFYFFRAEGRTGKGGDDRGRWGVGKYVFPRSSRANSFFGLTVRSGDPTCLLMGQAVLKTHACSGKHYKPDGGFGILEEGLILPVSDSALLDRFRTTFNVTRTNEPGLSIVIPWVDSEITWESLVQAVVRGYFYPILEGKLTVTLATPEREMEVNDGTLIETVKLLGDEAAAELLPLIELAEWASSRKPSDILPLNPAPPDRPTWSAPEMIPQESIALLQNQLERGERIALRVPLVVKANGKANQESYFDLFMVSEGDTRERTVFVREGIIISDVRPKRAHGIRSIVVVDHQPLATLLGDSENPAHTQWQKDSSNFRDKYPKLYGKGVIDFVTHCVPAVVSILSASQREEDPSLLKDFFSLPAPPETDDVKSRQKRKKKKQGDEPPEPVDPPEPRKRRYRLEQVPGGFRICAGDADASLPEILAVHAAYDVRRGNAFSKYNRADFDLNDLQFSIESQGLEVTHRKDNEIRAEVRDRDFRLVVSGFDEERDVCVNVQVKEATDVEEI